MSHALNVVSFFRIFEAAAEPFCPLVIHDFEGALNFRGRYITDEFEAMRDEAERSFASTASAVLFNNFDEPPFHTTICLNTKVSAPMAKGLWIFDLFSSIK